MWHAIRLEYDLSSYNIQNRNQFTDEATKCFKKLKGNQQEAHGTTYEFPKNWMVSSRNKLENYLDKITIVSNNQYNNFGFLNTYRKHFYAYSEHNKVVKSFDNHKYSMSNLEARHARNPHTKDHLFL